MNLAILQLDTVGNHAHISSSDILIEVNMIDLLLHELRVSKLAGQLAIVGEKQYTSGVAVKTTNGIDTLAASTLHQVHNGLAVLWVVAGGNIILGLVEQDVNLLLDAY